MLFQAANFVAICYKSKGELNTVMLPCRDYFQAIIETFLSSQKCLESAVEVSEFITFMLSSLLSRKGAYLLSLTTSVMAIGAIVVISILQLVT